MDAQSPPGGNNGPPERLWRNSAQDSLRGNRTATQNGLGCDGGCAEYRHQYSNLMVQVGRRGATWRESGEGERSSRGEHQGGRRAAKRCAGLLRPSVGEIRGEPTARAGAPFARSDPRAEAGWSPAAQSPPIRRCARSASGAESTTAARLRHGVPCRPRGLVFRTVTIPLTEQAESERHGVSFIHIRLPVCPVQLHADARRAHLRAGHRGRGGHPPTPADPARAGGLRGHRGAPRAATASGSSTRVHPDIVILDVGLPDLDGWQVLERIRDMSDVPVLMLTALGDRAGQGPRAQRRSRRLPDQAVQPGRAAGPPPGHPPAPGARRQRPGHHLRRRHGSTSTSPTRKCHARRRSRSS